MFRTLISQNKPSIYNNARVDL